MRVGAVSETITVTGETPVVDIQTSTQDAGGAATTRARSAFRRRAATATCWRRCPAFRRPASTSARTSSHELLHVARRPRQRRHGPDRRHERRVGVQRRRRGRLRLRSANAPEVQVTVAGGLGETDRGGPAFNIVPKTGGNTFSGTGFFSTAGKWSQGNNLDDELRSYGITEVPGADQELGHELRARRSDQARTGCGSSTTCAATASTATFPVLYANANAGDRVAVELRDGSRASRRAARRPR